MTEKIASELEARGWLDLRLHGYEFRFQVVSDQLLLSARNPPNHEAYRISQALLSDGIGKAVDKLSPLTADEAEKFKILIKVDEILGQCSDRTSVEEQMHDAARHDIVDVDPQTMTADEARWHLTWLQTNCVLWALAHGYKP